MIGKEILNYKIESLIGKGGMGNVFLASNMHINQKVAIKALNDNLADNPSIRERFRQEAKNLLTLDHQNIVKFLNFVENEDGLFIIMEYVDGITLEDFIVKKNGLIVESRAYPIFDQILEAMSYAHKRNIIHRDIKPANIILTNDQDGNFNVKVLDFGIAKILSESDEREKGWVVGTPLYMSPEQVRGEDVDLRSDIYALGVLLHQMLTGRAPYDSTTLSELEIQNKVVADPLPRMKDFYPKVTDKVQKIVDKATEKLPKDRYQNCTEMRKAWKKAVIGEPISPVLKYSAIALVLLILGAGWWIWDYNRIKIVYYKDYVEQWGVPQGIGELSQSEFEHRACSYRFEYKQRKLIRLSRVNNKGSVIEDGESERQERPINAKYLYRDNGLIETAYYLNRNNKTIFKKNYKLGDDGKINLVVFEYGDKYSAERVLPKGYTNNYVKLSDESKEKGKVSRYKLDFDDNGYLVRVRYSNSQNQNVEDNGIFGKRYERDSKGRIVKEYYLGENDAIKATSWGLAIKRFLYDDEDNWIEASYFGPDNTAAYDDVDGVSVYSLEYDQYGNLINCWNKNCNGKLMIPKKNGVAGINYKYNDSWQISQQTFLGTDKRPMFSSVAGYVSTKMTYDDNGYLGSVTFVDESGNVVLGNENIAKATYKNDLYGNIIEGCFWGKDGKPRESNKGNSKFVCKYDSLGNQISILYYGVNNKLCLISDGYAGNLYEFNNLNKVTKMIYLGIDGKPISKDGVYVLKYQYDQRGNRIRTGYYDASGTKLVLNNEGLAGWNSVYDENGNEIEVSYFDQFNKICSHPDGEAKYITKYDDRNNKIEIKYYDINGKICLVKDGYAGFRYKYDERGNQLESMPLGVDDCLAAGYLITRYKYDKNDNQTELSLYNRDLNPAINSKGYYKKISVYNDRNQILEESFYDVNNQLTILSEEKYALIKYQYDNRGNAILISYFDIYRKPCFSKNGNYASFKKEYDEMNRVVRELYFDVLGRPTSPSVYVPEGIAQYDKWGNINYIASADGKGRLINNPALGYSVTSRLYDMKGNMIMEQHFDAGKKPAIVDGYYKMIYAYNSDNKRIETKYYETSSKLRSTDYAIFRQKYNNEGLVIENTYFDYLNKPCETKSKFHKLVCIYENGKAKYYKYFRKDGSLLGVLDSNGKLVSSSAATSKTSGSNTSNSGKRYTSNDIASKLNSECPIQLLKNVVIQRVESGSGNQIKYFCTITDVSKYEIDDDEKSNLINVIESRASKSKFVQALLGRNIRVSLYLFDKANRYLSVVNY